MSILLFKLRHVPEDEAEEVRELLRNHGIDFYETTAGTWGISLPALWLRDNSQLDVGKQLIDDYQKQRAQKARRLYVEQCRQGKQRTLWTMLRESPLQYLAAILAIVFMLYLSTVPVNFLFQ